MIHHRHHHGGAVNNGHESAGQKDTVLKETTLQCSVYQVRQNKVAP